VIKEARGQSGVPQRAEPRENRRESMKVETETQEAEGGSGGGTQRDRTREGAERKHSDGEPEPHGCGDRAESGAKGRPERPRRGPGKSRRTRELGGRAPPLARVIAGSAAPAPQRSSLPLSLRAAETPTKKRNPGERLGTGAGRSGTPWLPGAAPTSPVTASGGSCPAPGFPDSAVEPSLGALGLPMRGGRSWRPRARRSIAAEVFGSRAPACRPGRDLPRGGIGERGAHAGSSELGAGPAAGVARRPGRPAGWVRLGQPREARLGCAARRLRPGRARGAGERRAERLRRQGVSAPNRERGRGQLGEGRARHRAGGRARPLPPGAQEGRCGRRVPAPLPRPHARWRSPCPASARPDGTVQRPGRLDGAGKKGHELGALPGFLCASTPLHLAFPKTGLSGHARPWGDTDGGVLSVGTEHCSLALCGAPTLDRCSYPGTRTPSC
jgi:hypothetical protein